MKLFTNQDAMKTVRALLYMLLIFDLVCSQLIVMIKVNNIDRQKSSEEKISKFW